MHVELIDLGPLEEPHLVGLLAHAHLATDNPASQADVELLADLAAGGGEDVLGVRVDANDPLRLDSKAGLLANPADDRLGDGLAPISSCRRAAPQLVVRAPLQQDLACVVDHDR